MALVTKGNGSGFYLTVTLKDTQGDASTLEYELDAIDMTAATADAATIIAALNAVTDSTISSYSISLRYEENAFAYPTGANNSDKARVTFRIQGQSDVGKFDIPAPVNTIFTTPTGPGNNLVDVDAAILVTYGALWAPAGVAFISDGERLSEMIDGRRVSSVKRFSDS